MCTTLKCQNGDVHEGIQEQKSRLKAERSETQRPRTINRRILLCVHRSNSFKNKKGVTSIEMKSK